MRPFQLQHSMLIHGAQLRNHMIQTEGEKQAHHVLNPTAKVSTSQTKSQAAKWVFSRVETNRAKQRKLKHPMTANVWLLQELPSSAHIQKEKMLCATHSAMETPLISHGPLKRPVSRIRLGQLHVDRVRTGIEITHYRTSRSRTFFPKLNEMSRFATLDLCL